MLKLFRRRGWLAAGAIYLALLTAAVFYPRTPATGGSHAQAKESGGPGGSPLRRPKNDTGAESAADWHAKGEAGSKREAGDKGDVKFDPIAVNGKFFEGWTKPKLALVISGRQDGYLEPCGCAGIENQKGGMSRRHALIQSLTAQGWPVLPIDVGGLVRRFGTQAEIQFSISAEALKTMGYKAVGFGSSDLRLSAGAVGAAAADQNIFVSANVNLFGLTPGVRIVEAGGMKVGITSVLGDTFRKQVNNDEIEFQPPTAAITKALPELKDCDLRILLAHATLEESQDLASKFPKFDFVVTAGGADEPPPRVAKIKGTDARLIEVGHKGMFTIVIGLYDDAKQPVRYQRVALDSRFKNTPEMKRLMTVYQDQLRNLGRQGLGIKPQAHPRGQVGGAKAGQFAGVDTCKACHPTAWNVWSGSKHAHATETLTKVDPPRQFDAECISCHVTGWNPQEFVPYVTGYESLKATPGLAGNTCENCHGPGKAHVDAENSKRVSGREEQRALMRLTKGVAEEKLCIQCHDLDNSPQFKFDAYWSKIEHKGKR